MAKALTTKTVLAHRMAEARTESGLSQRGLGVAAGMDDSVASPRINQYERGHITPPLHVMERIGRVTGHPLAWFYCLDDTLAGVILAYHRAKPMARRAIVKAALK